MILKKRHRMLFVVLWMIFLHVSTNSQVLNPNLTKNGTDPTEIRSRMDIVLAQLTNLANSYFMGTTFGGDYAFTDWLMAGADIPYIYARFSGQASTGFGDMRFRMIARMYQTKDTDFVKAVAGGIAMHLDTGDADRGTGIGQTIIIPNIAVSLMLADELLIIPQLRYLFSVKEYNNEIDEIRFQIDNVIDFSEEIWLSVMPEMIIDIKGERLNTYNLQFTLGKMLDKNWGISAVYTSNLDGEPRVESRSYLSLRYLF